ncbi:MAG: DUF998 domain-containing protein [Clostridium sp.]|uniref:DUF998 domain-containing protein n=1 Tax=Clostridium sp. TaxID=1506 RepID=UPI002910FF11|nr:DUF998 domain-containing protein [Clostridium sp.]MDU7337861.1 DUF998 domain-containing protein [Clostridium sp.]
MKLQKGFIFLGMLGVVSFLLHDILGWILIKGYNPITSYISVLTADGTPYSPFLRTLIQLYQLCFLVFSATLSYKAFKKYSTYTKIGFVLLFIVAAISIFTFGVFPMTMESSTNAQNIFHLLLILLIIILTNLSLFLLAFGYWKKEKILLIGKITLTFAVVFLLSNLLHLVAIAMHWNVLGLIQRVSAYSFLTFTFLLSYFYVKKGGR